MVTKLAFVLFLCGVVARAQDPVQQDPAADQAQEPTDRESATGHRPAIKTTEATKPVSPLKNFPRHILSDQKSIWTSPLRINRDNAKWWALFGTTTAGLIASDRWSSRQLPNTKDQVRVGNIASNFGAGYSLFPATFGMYFAGTRWKDERLRETGLIGLEALTDAQIVTTVIKAATQRERPLEGEGNGRFWQGAGRAWNGGASFPSGHTTLAWTLASVLAHEYPHPRIVPILAYGTATTIGASRFSARKHFASDVVLGGAIGWFLGDYAFWKRHNPSLSHPKGALAWLASHVSLQTTPVVVDPRRGGM